MKPKRQRAIKVDDELWEQFEEFCRSRDMSRSQMIRWMIRDLINSEGGSVGDKPPPSRKGRRSGP